MADFKENTIILLLYFTVLKEMIQSLSAFLRCRPTSSFRGVKLHSLRKLTIKFRTCDTKQADLIPTSNTQSLTFLPFRLIQFAPGCILLHPRNRALPDLG
jgi:hypothetical protein